MAKQASNNKADSSNESAISPTDSLARLAHRALLQEQRRFESTFPEEGQAPDPDGVHDLRVSIRRLRVALRMFRPVLPRGHKSLRRELKWLAGRLGQVRDLDVHREILERHRAAGDVSPEALRSLGEDHENDLATARDKLTRSLATRRVNRLRKKLARLVDENFEGRVPDKARALTIAETIPREIHTGLLKVHRLGSSIDENSTPEELHRVRIRTKQLRYRLELCAEVFPEIDDLIAKTKELQEILGLHQDAWVAAARLRADAAELSITDRGRLNPRVYAALIAAQDGEAAHQRALFREKWKQLGKSFSKIDLTQS